MTTGRKTTLLTLSWFLYSSSPNNCKHVSRAGISIITVNLGERYAFSDPSIWCEERIRETPWRNFPPMHNLFFYMFQLKHLTVTLIQIWTTIFFVKRLHLFNFNTSNGYTGWVIEPIICITINAQFTATCSFINALLVLNCHQIHLQW